tara:strand:- start:2094 stop:2585 length:492 start_codon:yes stop_codon:yes gene_type:complete
MIFNYRNWSIILIIISSISIISALTAEYLFNLTPCEMCLKQRYPYYAITILLIIFYFFKKFNNLLFLFLIEVCVLYGLFYSIWHVGIEQGLLEGPASCSGFLEQTDSIVELKKQITNKPIINCSEVIWTILGFSAATINTIILTFIFIFNTIFMIKYYNGFKK